VPGDARAADLIQTVIVPRARDLGGFEVRRALPSSGAFAFSFFTSGTCMQPYLAFQAWNAALLIPWRRHKNVGRLAPGLSEPCLG
jgi:hypothetical protein